MDFGKTYDMHIKLYFLLNPNFPKMISTKLYFVLINNISNDVENRFVKIYSYRYFTVKKSYADPVFEF